MRACWRTKDGIHGCFACDALNSDVRYRVFAEETVKRMLLFLAVMGELCTNCY